MGVTLKWGELIEVNYNIWGLAYEIDTYQRILLHAKPVPGRKEKIF